MAQPQEQPRPSKPRELFDAVGDLALQIYPHNMDTARCKKVRDALTVLVDHIIDVGEARRINCTRCEEAYRLLRALADETDSMSWHCNQRAGPALSEARAFLGESHDN